MGKFLDKLRLMNETGKDMARVKGASPGAWGLGVYVGEKMFETTSDELSRRGASYPGDRDAVRNLVQNVTVTALDVLEQDPGAVVEVVGVAPEDWNIDAFKANMLAFQIAVFDLIAARVGI